MGIIIDVLSPTLTRIQCDCGKTEMVGSQHDALICDCGRRFAKDGKRWVPMKPGICPLKYNSPACRCGTGSACNKTFEDCRDKGNGERFGGWSPWSHRVIWEKKATALKPGDRVRVNCEGCVRDHGCNRPHGQTAKVLPAVTYFNGVHLLMDHPQKHDYKSNHPKERGCPSSQLIRIEEEPWRPKEGELVRGKEDNVIYRITIHPDGDQYLGRSLDGKSEVGGDIVWIRSMVRPLSEPKEEPMKKPWRPMLGEWVMFGSEPRRVKKIEFPEIDPNRTAWSQRPVAYFDEKSFGVIDGHIIRPLTLEDVRTPEQARQFIGRKASAAAFRGEIAEIVGYDTTRTTANDGQCPWQVKFITDPSGLIVNLATETLTLLPEADRCPRCGEEYETFHNMHECKPKVWKPKVGEWVWRNSKTNPYTEGPVEITNVFEDQCAYTLTDGRSGGHIFEGFRPLQLSEVQNWEMAKQFYGRIVKAYDYKSKEWFRGIIVLYAGKVRPWVVYEIQTSKPENIYHHLGARRINLTQSTDIRLWNKIYRKHKASSEGAAFCDCGKPFGVHPEEVTEYLCACGRRYVREGEWFTLLPEYAKGGVVNPKNRPLIGVDNGEPEKIIPLKSEPRCYGVVNWDNFAGSKVLSFRRPSTVDIVDMKAEAVVGAGSPRAEIITFDTIGERGANLKRPLQHDHLAVHGDLVEEYDYYLGVDPGKDEGGGFRVVTGKAGGGDGKRERNLPVNQAEDNAPFDMSYEKCREALGYKDENEPTLEDQARIAMEFERKHLGPPKAGLLLGYPIEKVEGLKMPYDPFKPDEGMDIYADEPGEKPVFKLVEKEKQEFWDKVMVPYYKSLLSDLGEEPADWMFERVNHEVLKMHLDARKKYSPTDDKGGFEMPPEVAAELWKAAKEGKPIVGKIPIELPKAGELKTLEEVAKARGVTLKAETGYLKKSVKVIPSNPELFGITATARKVVEKREAAMRREPGEHWFKCPYPHAKKAGKKCGKTFKATLNEIGRELPRCPKCGRTVDETDIVEKPASRIRRLARWAWGKGTWAPMKAWRLGAWAKRKGTSLFRYNTYILSGLGTNDFAQFVNGDKVTVDGQFEGYIREIDKGAGSIVLTDRYHFNGSPRLARTRWLLHKAIWPLRAPLGLFPAGWIKWAVWEATKCWALVAFVAFVALVTVAGVLIGLQWGGWL